MTQWRARRWWAVVVALLGLLVVLGAAAPAGAEDPDSDPTLTFQWDDPKMKEAFKACLEVVDWVAHGRDGDEPHPLLVKPWEDVPGDIDVEDWARAINTNWLVGWPHLQEFTYRPHCDRLLPDDYETRISIRYYSEAYTSCQAVVGGDSNHERPPVVPAWYWEVSERIDDCYLLLPLGAFDLGPDENAWSQWSSDDVAEPPDSHADPRIMEEYRLCREYIEWRVDNGQALNPLRPLGDIYDDPPRNAVPKRLWHRAIDFYVDHDASSHAGGEKTVPANWDPDCSILLLTSDCRLGESDRSLLPEECLGPHPTSHYDIGFSQYDDPDEEGMPSIPRNMWGASTNAAYHLGKGGVQVALWAVRWSYNFDIIQYDPLAIEIGDAYKNSLLSHPEFRLRELFWLLLAGWAGILALRGKAAVAGTEVLLTIVLLLLFGVLVDQRETYMNATWRLMDKTSAALLVAGMGEDPSDDKEPNRDELVNALRRQVHFTFVEEPYDYLNWGQSLGSANDTGNPLRACAAAREGILSHGPHGADRWPRQHMASAGQECAGLVEFNRDPDGTRMLGALLVMVSALVVGVLLALVGLTVVVAKIIAVLLFAVLPFVVVLVILPAQGRRLAWTWATTVMQVVLAVVGMSFLLSLLLLTLNKLTSLTTEVDLIERFALMDIVVLIVWAARRSLLRSGQAFAARLSEYLSSTRASGVTWQQAAVGARPGLNLLNVDRTAGLAVGTPLNLATTSLLLRMHERRAAGRGYRNLERVAYWKRTANARNARWAVRRNLDPAQPWTRPTRRQPLP